jgi:hypothetical protein
MLRKAYLFAAFLVFAVALAWAGGNKDEPWNSKPYDKWNQKDVTAILNSSPWAVQTRVAADWLGKKKSGKGGPIDLQMRAANDQINPPDTPQSSLPGGAGSRSGGPAPVPEGGGATEASQAASVDFAVRWDSARVMREALARNAILAGTVKPADAAEYLSQVVENYQVAVAGQDMTPFATLTEDQLKAGAYLEVSPSKRKVSPVSVVIRKFPDGKKINSVTFSFSKQVENGEPLIRPDDTAVEFRCKVEHFDLSTTFDTRKMVVDKAPDL